MGWGTFDTNEHTPKTDLSGRVETTTDVQTIYIGQRTGDPDYTLSRTGHGETPVPQSPPTDD